MAHHPLRPFTHALALNLLISSLASAQPVQFPTWQNRYTVTLDDRFGFIPPSDARHVQGPSSLISAITSTGVASILITPLPTLGANELRFREALTGLPASFAPIPQNTSITVPSSLAGGEQTIQINLNALTTVLTPRVDASGHLGVLQSSQNLEAWAIRLGPQGATLVRRLGDFAPQFAVPLIVPITIIQRPFDAIGRRHDNGRWAALVRLSSTSPSPAGLLGNLQEAPGSTGPVRPYLFRAGEQLTDGPITLTTTDSFATPADLTPSPSWYFTDDGSMAIITQATASQAGDPSPQPATVTILLRINPQGQRTLIARTKAPWEDLADPGSANPKLVANFTVGPAMNSQGDIAFATSGGLLDSQSPNGQRGAGLIVAYASEGHALRQVLQSGSQIWPGPTSPSLPPNVPLAQFTGLITGGDVQIAESGDVFIPVNTSGTPGGLSIVCYRARDARLIRAVGFDEGLINLPGWRTRELIFSPLVMTINRAGQLITASRLAGDTTPFSTQAFVGWDPVLGAQFLLPNALQFTENTGATRSLQAASLFSSPTYWQATSMGLASRLSERGEFLWRYASNPGGQMTLASRIRTACGPADLGRAGGEALPDGQLDNNDFVAFISAFFDQSPKADLASEGADPTPDGTFDNNDFVVFIAAFFAGCP